MKHSFIFIFVFLASFVSVVARKLPEPYRSVKVLPLDDHGWFAAENKRGLTHFIHELKPKIVIELGSWLGASTVFMAEQLQDGAVLYAVDNWNKVGSAGVQKNAFWSSKLGTLYQSFLSNVIHKELTQVIIPVRMNTQEASRALDVMADLIYVDASHEEEDVYNDIIQWYPHLAVGGIMCGDDWSFPSVQKALSRATKEINQIVEHDGTFWWLKVKK